MLELHPSGFSKANIIHQTVGDLISRFKCGRAKNNFSIAIVNYDHRVVVRTPPTVTKDIDELEDYDPTNGLGGTSPHVAEAIETALRVADEFLVAIQNVPCLVNIALLTDGYDADKEKTKQVVEMFSDKKRITLRGIGYLPTESIHNNEDLEYLKTLTYNVKEIYKMENVLGFFMSGISYDWIFSNTF